MKTLRQIFRYGVVGLASNLLLYLIYLWITTLGMGPKLAMTLLYAVGVAQTFLFNKRWTFGHRGFFSATLCKYVISYALGYLFNFLALVILVDRAGFPHQIVQAILIFIIAGMLFLLQKTWVFRQSALDSIDR